MLIRGDNPDIQKIEINDLQFAAMMRGDRRSLLHKSNGSAPIKSGYTLYKASNNNDLQSLIWINSTQTMTVSEAAEVMGMPLQSMIARLKRYHVEEDIEITPDTVISLIDSYLDPNETIKDKGLPEGLELFLEW